MPTEFATEINTVCAYHQQTKHHLDRFVRALSYMDWANQPNPCPAVCGCAADRLGPRRSAVGTAEILGITDLSWQSLYHFTVGGPREDRRLQTQSAYGHL